MVEKVMSRKLVHIAFWSGKYVECKMLIFRCQSAQHAGLCVLELKLTVVDAGISSSKTLLETSWEIPGWDYRSGGFGQREPR